MRVWMLVLLVLGIFGVAVLAFPLFARHTAPHPHYVTPTSDVREIAKAAIMYPEESQEPSQLAARRKPERPDSAWH